MKCRIALLVGFLLWVPTLGLAQNPTPVTEGPAISGLSDYSGLGVTVTTLSATSGTVITANTVYINAILCNNTDGSTADTLNITDTAANYLAKAVSIAAKTEFYAVSPQSWLKVVGLKMWSANGTINCIISGKN